jgi:hypothetical protein
VANTLVGAIQRTVKPRLPVGDPRPAVAAWSAGGHDRREASAGRRCGCGGAGHRLLRAAGQAGRAAPSNRLPEAGPVSRHRRRWRFPLGTGLSGDPGSGAGGDSKRGPAVFFRLRQLRRGDTVTIRWADGSSVRFVVQRTEQYPKDRFPTDEVSYPTLTPPCGW